jgi:hypothetical protein
MAVCEGGVICHGRHSWPGKRGMLESLGQGVGEPLGQTLWEVPHNERGSPCYFRHPAGMASLTSLSFGCVCIVEIEGLCFDERATLVCRLRFRISPLSAETGHGNDVSIITSRSWAKRQDVVGVGEGSGSLDDWVGPICESRIADR